MPQSLSRILIHTIFSTKNRESVFTESAFRHEMHAFVGGVAKTLKCFPIEIGGTADHIHILSTLDRSVCVADFVKETKRCSTSWIQEQDRGLARFHWQAGYGVFSVSESNCDVVTDYIKNQEEHHRKTTFQDEYRMFCERHVVGIDEQYVWD